MRDKIREMEWRHSTGVDDTEVSASEGRGVRAEEESDEPEKKMEDELRKKSLAARVTRWTWKKWRQRTKKSYG